MTHQNNIQFSHNFCESRLNNNEGPEYFNAYSAIFITLIPFYYGIPVNYHLKKVALMLILNGGFSFYYHYSLVWLGKQLDEVTMFLANYYYLCGLLKYYTDEDIKMRITTMSTIILPVLISVNTIPQYDIYFPYIFTLYTVPTVFIIVDIAITHNKLREMLLNLIITSIGCISWVISEYKCNNITTYGHVLWHIFFIIGIYRFVKMYDDCNSD
jgi:hypothetical protein